MRIAWFSPLPPARTGIAGYSASLLAMLENASLRIDRIEAAHAHDFVWRHRQTPYDLVVYQLGNSPWHDYMWAYLFNYPGLVVLHDARVHHARAAQLLRDRRIDDYRREFAYDHPDASAAGAEYAIEGLKGSAFYLWPMTRSVVESARLAAVHNDFVAQELRERHPAAAIERIRLGTPVRTASPHARDDIRRRYNLGDDSIVFVSFGLVTAEKRIEPILRALRVLTSRGVDAHLLLVGASGFEHLETAIAAERLERRVHVTGYVDDERIADYLSAGEVSLSLRWPTAEETSASWIESLAAGKATIITSLPHNADVPPSVAVSIDLLDEDAALLAAMSRLAGDRALRETLGSAAREYWRAHHRVELMADDYRRLITQAASMPAPSQAGLPAHLTHDYGSLAAAIANEIGVEL
jgi:glycosyltransferase involved in cell wall biosynthesis